MKFKSGSDSQVHPPTRLKCELSFIPTLQYYEQARPLRVNSMDPSVLRPQFWLNFLCRILTLPPGRSNDCISICQQCGHLPGCLYIVSWTRLARAMWEFGQSVDTQLFVIPRWWSGYVSLIYKFRGWRKCGASSYLTLLARVWRH